MYDADLRIHGRALHASWRHRRVDDQAWQEDGAVEGAGCDHHHRQRMLDRLTHLHARREGCEREGGEVPGGWRGG